ncbi:NAD(P) transhydrogenase subunit alpha [Methylobacterium sp. GXS13]|jgi:NAD(P) transhydrogenase subunit alpha|uniref:Re/Si-specific NAD(P)(+) transhydrogenase subunit alpha n=1 Tax=Methylobacterium sp. GXS13 TaxID=1730094 RepID=UPI00071B5FDB|nr:Re/Si-specific NAD(P)(+) transhydrogenase subunit alpha [Methylobacterium sp. GXS13]KST57378.1 NAD(P) transhydrogenase subunit alpha [Methylobacterium sp. GXS13]
MRIAVLSETDSAEPRVAAVPETVKKFKTLGADITVQAGAGLKAGILDAEYEAAGAEIAGSASDAARDADLVLKVRRPAAEELSLFKRGATIIAIMDPYGNEPALQAMADSGVSGFAMELMPRITRAQVMDVLSSQANLAGYRAVVDGAAEYGRAMPMMMTAAGTVPAARVFIMGVGVAGLQAIATARRLGAVVTATDVRPATKEQVESLGAKFVAVEDDEFKQAETAGGYAKEMSAGYQAKQAELVKGHIAKQDIVITTALIPGRPAPKLVSEEMVASMKPGSVLIDLAVERGGNVAGAKPGEIVVTDRGVKIVGHTNVPGRLAATASSLYARNLYAFAETLIDKESKALAIKWDDELVKATNLTRDGSVVHASFQSKTDGPASEAAAVGLAKSETGKAESAPPPSGAN